MKKELIKKEFCKLKVMLIFLFFLIFLISGVQALADSDNLSLDIDLSDLNRYAVFEIYQQKEITPTSTDVDIFIQVNNFSAYTNTSKLNLNWNFAGENETIFGLELKINEKLYLVPFIEPSDPPFKLVLRYNDQVSIKYNVNKKMNPLINKFWYPYDKYEYYV